MRGRQFSPHGGRRGRGGPGRVREVKAEIPRRAAPDYITKRIGDRFVPDEIAEIAERTPPGHRFLLYFHGMSDEVKAEYIEREEQERRDRLNRAKQGCDWPVFEKTMQEGRGDFTKKWVPIKNGRRHALKACEAMGRCATGLLRAWHARMREVAPAHAWQAEVQTIAPLITGGGNPHPVENGFAFLNPYGVPYLAASGVKGALRRVAEDMAAEGSGGWTIAHIWALFGFDENSKWYRGEDEDEYRAMMERAAEQALAILEAWKERVHGSLPEEAQKLDGIAFAERLLRERNWRRQIKWRGLLCFADAVPHPGAELMVDVLNPHHGAYYRAEPESATPHDAENPVPVFFLALAPGARLTLRAWPLVSEEHDVLRACGDWRALLDALADRMTDEAEGCGLGFGAKTSVGYGALARAEGAPEASRAAEEAEPTGADADSEAERWLSDKVNELAKAQHARPEDVWRAKSLAEAWRAIEDEDLKARVHQAIRRRWEEEGWWDAPPGKSAKQAKAIYEGGE
ncbi:MAG: type III-B CRISPR module RAMP protein Cmr6 [Zetaproteobacteria bacterium]|nr:MAG: type III-B CRISPR module RAMP protein Cmr6 [Zetaproteobacteria bacterium]